MIDLKSITDSLLWNIFLIALGSFIFVVGYNGIAAHHLFVPGGLYGLSVLCNNYFEWGDLSIWLIILSAPLFLLAWRFVSRRFFFLNLFATLFISFMTKTLGLNFGVHNEIYASISAGLLMGLGSGIILRSYGGGGGLDVLAVVINRKLGLRFGVFYMIINGIIMMLAYTKYSPDTLIASLIMLAVSSWTTDYALSMFNQRKAVRIITYDPNCILKELMAKKFHATIIPAKGGYSGLDVGIVYTLTDNLRLRNIEQVVFECDPRAIFIVENTFSVVGGSIAARKVY